MPQAGASFEPGFLIRNVLQDHRDLGEDLTVVEPQDRHVALRIDRFEFSGLRIDLHELERNLGFAQCDVGSQ